MRDRENTFLSIPIASIQTNLFSEIEVYLLVVDSMFQLYFAGIFSTVYDLPTYNITDELLIIFSAEINRKV